MNRTAEVIVSNDGPPKEASSWVEIHLRHFEHNVGFLRSKIGLKCKLMAVVKANAYGHGAIEASRFLLTQGVERLAVATVEEGIKLRAEGVNAPILLLNSILPQQINKVVEYRLTPTVYTVSFAEKVADAAERLGVVYPIHIRIDLASNGLGIAPANASQIIDRVLSLPSLHIEGVYTHLVSAYRNEMEQVEQDLHTFNRIQQYFLTQRESSLEKANQSLQPAGNQFPAGDPLIHAASSPAILSFPDSYYDMVRAGTSIYGLPSFEDQDEAQLKPVMYVKSKVCDIQCLDHSEMRGYTYSVYPESAIKVATVPMGYSHAPFLLQVKKPEVLIRGRRAVSLGAAHMSHLFVDVTHLPHVEIGDEVVLLGEQGQEKLYAQHIIKEAGVDISRCESVCFISESVPRYYIR